MKFKPPALEWVRELVTSPAIAARTNGDTASPATNGITSRTHANFWPPCRHALRSLLGLGSPEFALYVHSSMVRSPDTSACWVGVGGISTGNVHAGSGGCSARRRYSALARATTTSFWRIV